MAECIAFAKRGFIMMKGKWIWASNDDVVKDSYADFIGKFYADVNGGAVTLDIACDSIYSVQINGELAAFGGCADYPDRKSVV